MVHDDGGNAPPKENDSSNQIGSQNVDCPSCGKFTWHLECLKNAFVDIGVDLPDLSKKDWKCPHCRSS